MTKLIFIEKTQEKHKSGHYYWVAKCECGNIIKCLKTKRLCGECLKIAAKNHGLARIEKRLKSMNLDLSFSPTNMYFWGFLWADGHIKNDSVRMSLLQPDMADITNIIPKYFNSYYVKNTSNIRNNKPQTTIILNNRNYFDFLISHGYDNKITPSQEILEHEYFYLWLRGFIDGDGYWYFNKKNHCRQFGISGKKDYDWEFINNCFKKIGITPKITLSRYHRLSNSNSSLVRVTSIDDIKKLYYFLYKDHKEIGLRRKHEKVKDLLYGHIDTE